MERLDRALVDDLRGQPSEGEWLEFMGRGCAPARIGQHLSALSNSCRLLRCSAGYLVFGIEDGTHAVKGTAFDPGRKKTRGQGLLPWLHDGLQPNPGVEAAVVEHPDGRVVVFCVGPAWDQPVSFRGTEYVRVGASTTRLSRHPHRERRIWTTRPDWSGETCPGATLDDLDPEAVAAARRIFAACHPAETEAAADWDDAAFLDRAGILRGGAVTNTAVLLLGKSEAAALLSPSAADRFSWILRDGDGELLDSEDLPLPFLFAMDRVSKRVGNRIARCRPNRPGAVAPAVEYDPWALREALRNAIAHQDYRAGGGIVVTESPGRVVVSNRGRFLPGDVETALRGDAPLVYRNPFLAWAMVTLGLMDTAGGGILRMFDAQRKRSFAPPTYDLSQPDEVRVEIPGGIR